MPYSDPQARAEYIKKWSAANKDKTSAAMRRYLAKPRSKELRRKYESARRARRRAAFVEHIDPQIVYVSHDGICGICGQAVSRDDFHVDHIVALANGGLHMYSNCQPAHPLCNSFKGDR